MKEVYIVTVYVNNHSAKSSQQKEQKYMRIFVLISIVYSYRVMKFLSNFR